MDISAIVAASVSAALGISAVSTFVNKVLPQTVKYVSLAKDAVNTLDDIVESLKDGKLTQEEIDKVKADIVQFKSDMAI